MNLHIEALERVALLELLLLVKKSLLDLSSLLLDANGKEQLLEAGKVEKMYLSSSIKLSLESLILTLSLLTHSKVLMMSTSLLMYFTLVTA